MSLPAQRAAEFHTLMEPYARTIQSLRHDLVADSARERILEVQGQRRIRLDELAVLLNTTTSETWDVDEMAERWIRTHPLTLTNQIVAKELAKIESVISVAVQVGEPRPNGSGRYYGLHVGDMKVQGGAVVFTLPEAVAEEFRQQGRRQLQREHADLMAVQSHR